MTEPRVFIGACRLELHLPAAQSLKQKRAVLQSATSRVRREFPVSIAEVEAHERHNLAVLGMAIVSNESYHAREVLTAAVRFIEALRLDADVGSVEIDVLPMF